MHILEGKYPSIKFKYRITAKYKNERIFGKLLVYVTIEMFWYISVKCIAYVTRKLILFQFTQLHIQYYTRNHLFERKYSFIKQPAYLPNQSYTGTELHKSKKNTPELHKKATAAITWVTIEDLWQHCHAWQSSGKSINMYDTISLPHPSMSS